MEAFHTLPSPPTRPIWLFTKWQPPVFYTNMSILHLWFCTLGEWMTTKYSISMSIPTDSAVSGSKSETGRMEGSLAWAQISNSFSISGVYQHSPTFHSIIRILDACSNYVWLGNLGTFGILMADSITDTWDLPPLALAEWSQSESQPQGISICSDVDTERGVKWRERLLNSVDKINSCSNGVLRLLSEAFWSWWIHQKSLLTIAFPEPPFLVYFDLSTQKTCHPGKLHRIWAFIFSDSALL